MIKKLLLIRTPDKRRFFTYRKNLSKVLEFAKTFQAELFSVEVEGAEVLELNKVSAAFCLPSYNCDVRCLKAKKISRKRTRSGKRRTDLLTNAVLIRGYLRSQLLANQTISLKDLQKKFEKLALTDSCLYSHLSQVRKEMEGEGYIITKINTGEYAIQGD